MRLEAHLHALAQEGDSLDRVEHGGAVDDPERLLTAEQSNALNEGREVRAGGSDEVHRVTVGLGKHVQLTQSPRRTHICRRGQSRHGSEGTLSGARVWTTPISLPPSTNLGAGLVALAQQMSEAQL